MCQVLWTTRSMPSIFSWYLAVRRVSAAVLLRIAHAPHVREARVASKDEVDSVHAIGSLCLPNGWDAVAGGDLITGTGNRRRLQEADD
jgi:hypothetical protein